MDSQELARRKAEVVSRHGDWTAMAIDLGGGLSTLPPAPDWRLARIVQIARDVLRRPLAGCRVLDLACLEGHYSIEPALKGATVLGIEGRADNIAKARFAAEALGLQNCRFVQEDVRSLSASTHGAFDLVIASGILYHLDAPAALDFVAAIADVCTDCAIIDTYVAARPEAETRWRETVYHGRYYREHAAGATDREKLADLWASIDNTRSFWLTKPSLLNLLTDVGFATVLECHNPAMDGLTADRVTLVAIKGEPELTPSSPATSGKRPPRWAEVRPGFHPSQDPRDAMRRRIGRYVPSFVKRTAKSALRTVGVLKSEGRLPWHK
ncbi:MAG: methyltransferase domain-containing protein [Gemmataceae bacterium]